jgi:glyoxylase-like metal-dependent hydrolase (beta-lactamase superfamily II)
MTQIVPGELQSLRNNFYRLCAPNPGPMTGPGTNTYFYGKEELAVFDPGPPMGEHVESILAAQDVLGAPITKIFASHTHNDHSPAVAKLEKFLTQVEIIGAPPPEGHEYEDQTFKPTYQPAHNEVFEHERQKIIAIHTPGHVANHFCYLLEEHDLLTTGDHLMNGSTVVIIPPKGSMRDYIHSLKKLQDYAIGVMAPGHGELIDKPSELVQWTINHRLKREAKVLAALNVKQPQSIEQLVPMVYDDTPLSLHQVAALSLHAHLIKLELESKAVSNEHGWRKQT